LRWAPLGNRWVPDCDREWGTARALAAGATQDEITDVLLAIAPVAGLGQMITEGCQPGTLASACSLWHAPALVFCR
jgi:hypothetical protein